MTEKQEQILHHALRLFTSEGYHAVPTSKIAREAGVSEGLIFRHFKRKKGLLLALIQQGEQRFGEMIGPLLLKTNPREVLAGAIQLPFKVPEQEYPFWRLQYQMKWQKEFYNPQKTAVFVGKLRWAFEQLDYAQPSMEAKLMEQILDSVAIAILRDGKSAHQSMEQFLLSKYQL